MKNVALFVAAGVFIFVAIAQFLRFKFGIDLIVGHEHHIPVGLSLYLSGVALVLGLWMLIAAFYKRS